MRLLLFFCKYDGFLVCINGDLNCFGHIVLFCFVFFFIFCVCVCV